MELKQEAGSLEENVFLYGFNSGYLVPLKKLIAHTSSAKGRR